MVHRRRDRTIAKRFAMSIIFVLAAVVPLSAASPAGATHCKSTIECYEKADAKRNASYSGCDRAFWAGGLERERQDCRRQADDQYQVDAYNCYQAATLDEIVCFILYLIYLPPS